MRVKCSGSITRDTGVDCLSLYHFDWNTPLKGVHKLTEACGVSTVPCLALVILSGSEESKLAVD
jgi:hypothetical protein